ncbi:HEXXH motif domain-containing protein [Streptomyces sp. ACA25]|uniref:HEXXH motif domain-containing protein n=1 Tax=Streptomyces sp. ACA25 TaxID=3022596 RepID=UPI002307737D|nr:HEXXH motif domain-containing protein [Streptomyces sp. ACA25]MDB1088320.1 HEXXH motif domain-containing protein [Streptomyces sp. ACA25]
MPRSPTNSGPRPARHRTPSADLDRLAAGSLGPDAAQRLRLAERSRRLLMLRAVMEAAGEGTAAPLPPLRAAMELLSRAEQVRPDVVAGILDHAGTGVWAVRVLERLGGDGVPGRATETKVPLWEELGYLHTLAATAALRAGVAGTTLLPVRDGGITLPTLGRIRLPPALLRAVAGGGAAVAGLRLSSAGAGPAVVTAGDRHLCLPSDLRRAGSGWQPLRSVSWHVSERAVPVALEDLDPYRDFRSPGRQPPALTSPEADRWAGLLREAGALLRGRHPRAAGMLSGVLRSVVPLPAAPRFRTASASFSEAYGSALVSLPRDAVELAVTLLHEARHSALNGLDHQLPLCRDSTPEHGPLLLYAPWRGDPRPPSGLLHGTYAFAGIAEFWRTERQTLTGAEAELAHFEFAAAGAAVREALRTLLTGDALTSPGRRFVDRLAAETAGWPDEAVPARPLALARSAAADLRAVWRARHTRPHHPGRVRELADEWLRGTDPRTVAGVSSRLRSPVRFASPDPRDELRRVLLAEPEALTAHAHGALYSARRHPALVSADLALLSGALGRAARGYRSTLLERPGSAAAWAGLGLALGGNGDRAAAGALLQRPEVVRAVWQQAAGRSSRPPDPVTVADWIGRIPGMCERP